MAITVQQFDFIAQIQGINAALAAAEQAGGVTGTRDAAPAPSMTASTPFFGGDIFPGTPTGSFDLTSGVATGGAPFGETPGGAGGTPQSGESQKIADWIQRVIGGGYNFSRGVETSTLIRHLSAILGRTVSQAEFDAVVAPSLSSWRAADTSGASMVGSIANAGAPVNVGTPWNPPPAVGVASAGAGTSRVDRAAMGDLTLGAGSGGPPPPYIPQDPGDLGTSALPYKGEGRVGQNAFLDQDPGDMFRRVGAEIFGPRSMLQQKVLGNLIDRYSRFSPITQYGMENPGTGNFEEAKFRQFAQSSRPSGQSLGAQLAKIYGTLPGDVLSPESARFEDAFENPEAETDWGRIQPGFRTGIQPFLARLSPFTQSSMGKLLEQKFRDLYAQQPTQFTSARDVFKELTRRNYLPTYSP